MLRARLTATFLSDGHQRSSGRIGYVEGDAERIKRVKDILKQLGDVEIRGYSRDGLKEFEIPREVGTALIRWGDMTPRDKAITNPGLPKALLEKLVIHLPKSIKARDFDIDTTTKLQNERN